MGARLDQHFLLSEDVARRIVSAAQIRASDPVVEIGPGRGILTSRLLAVGARVTAVEYDARLHAELARRFQSEAGLRLIHSDFLQLDMDTLPSPAGFVANLPYSVATPILQRLLAWPGCVSAVLMFQKEVAERIVAAAGSRSYGILSVSVALQARAKWLFEVPKTCFSPRPAVDSAVVRLDRRPIALPEGLSPERLMRVVKASFNQRRKQAVNAMARVLGLERAVVEAALRHAGVDSKSRAEDISLDGFIAIARHLPI